jgi:LPS-assembly protein
MSSAETFKFETSNIEIVKNGELIYANKGKAISSDNNLEVQAEKFEYIRNIDLLNAFNNGLALIKSENLKIEFDEMRIDQKNSMIKANGNIKVYQEEKKILIETSSIIYDQKNNILSSSTKSVLTDSHNNIFNVDSFYYEINKDVLKIVNANFKDKEKNNFITSLAYINTKTNKLFGKSVSIDLNNKSFDKNNEPRLKGNSVINDNEFTEITKGVFTTCKKRDKCPPWQLSAEKIQHDKKKKIINYKNAWLKVYDVPIMYFPKFFHPDPTVKRKSGFLVPTFKNSPNSGSFLNTPYFLAIAQNKDATFSPRFYAEDKFLLQTEYRQKNLVSSHVSDFSLFAKKKGISKSHFFYEYAKKFNIKNFDEGNIDFKFQQTSNDTYIKANKLKSSIMENDDLLENSLGINLYSNDLSIVSELTVYEDLDKKDSDRFEYILPKLDLVKKINNKTKLDGDFSFESQNLIRNFNTNIFEKTISSNILFTSILDSRSLKFFVLFGATLKDIFGFKTFLYFSFSLVKGKDELN